MNNIGVKLAVRLLKEGITIGSGVYIPLPKHDFDIIGTAKHCLCNKNPEVCKESNTDICDNCSEVEFKALEYKNKINAIKPWNEDPIFLNDRDVAFIKIEKQESNDIIFNIHKDQLDQLLYSYGFPSGTDSEGTDIRFEIPIDLDNNSKLSLPIKSNSTSNLEDQQENLAGLSGSGVYAFNGNLVGIYTGTQSIANGFAVKFDNHIISFLKGQGIDITGNIFESFTPYQEKAFEGFDSIRNHIESIAKDVIKEVSPHDILNQLGKDISYFPEFTTVEELISHLENNKNRNIRMWEGWLQLLTYLKTLQVDIKDSSNIKIKLEIEENERKYSLEIKVNLLFTEKSSFETSVDYIHRKFQRENSSNACLVFRSDSDQKERKIFNAQKEIIENVAGINPLEPPRFNIGTIGLSRISDVVINENKMNQVRVELKKCFQDAIK